MVYKSCLIDKDSFNLHYTKSNGGFNNPNGRSQIFVRDYVLSSDAIKYSFHGNINYGSKDHSFKYLVFGTYYKICK